MTPPSSQTIPPRSPVDRMRVMDVARYSAQVAKESGVGVGWRYTKARDMMLTGKLGEPDYGDGRPLTVPRAEVERYFRELTAKRSAGKTPASRGGAR